MQNNIPLPEQRLCQKHGEPIIPAYWRSGARKVGCKFCYRATRRRYDNSEKGHARNRRYANSEKGRAARRQYANSEKGRATCRRYDNSEKGRARNRRYDNSEKGRAKHRRQNYKITMERRKQVLTGGRALYGIELFNRCIGYNLISPSGAITI